MTIENLGCRGDVHKESSLVIPTIKERRLDLFELLNCLSHQLIKPYEIVVICDGEISVPVEIVGKYKELGIRLDFVEAPSELTLGTTRNIGIKKTTTKFLFFLDDDTLPDQLWFAEMLKSFEAGADVVGGVSMPLFKPGVKTPLWWDEALIGPYVAVGNQHIKFKQDGIWGCNFALRRDAIEKIGCFDEDLGLRKYGPKLLAEDSEFVKRAVLNGLIVQFNPHAVVYHKLNAKKINLANLRMRAWQEGLTMKELKQKYRSYSTIVFFKVLLFKAFRGAYFVLVRKSRATALPISMILLIYELMGWLRTRIG